MDKLAQEAQALLGVHLNPRQLASLAIYQQELAKWNARYNLTAIDDPDKVRVKHFLDSLSCSLAMRGTRMAKVIDIGTGAGFPGLPLKILYPQMQLTLVDSVAKKVAFCEHIVKKLGLENVSVIQARAEEVGQMAEHREQYDWALGRAVATLPVLAEYLLPLVAVGGHMLALKGETAPAEVHATEHATRLLGGQIRQLIPVTLPGVVEQHYLVIVDKVAVTHHRYPRRAGIPAKRPLVKKPSKTPSS